MKKEYKAFLGIILMLILISMMWNFISDWVLNLVHSLLGLWVLVETLEMPHKFYGLTIMLFISWKLLEAVLNVWIRGVEYSIKLIKSGFANEDKQVQEENK